MNATRKIVSTITLIGLAVLAQAADPAADQPKDADAKKLEQQIIGYWAPDADAMAKIMTEEMGLSKEEAAKAGAEFAHLAFHAEQGKVHAYTKQGVLTTPYAILAADKEAKTLTLQAKSPPNAPEHKPAHKTEPLKISINGDQITVLGGQMPFILRKIGEDEFLKRKAALPADKVGP